MMKTSGRVTSCCVALFFALTSVSAVQRLNSIYDLNRINFGQSVPKHSLLLLHWFANTVDIDYNDVIRLHFDPNRGDYGSHHYGNFEGLLDPLPWGNRYRYYTIGNLHQETTMPLPSHVVSPPRGYVGRNRDRIIVRVMEQNTGGRTLQRIDQVYITQHYGILDHPGTYDPDHTYRITINLLRQIRGQNQQSILQGNYFFNQQNNRPENNSRPENYYRPQNYRPENNDGSCWALIIFTIIFVCVILFLAAYFPFIGKISKK